MGLIEQAARRLEELRRAGVEVPEPGAASGDGLIVEAARALAEAPRPRAGTRVEIALARLAAEGYITPDAPRSRIAEEFRILKRPLIANAAGKGPAPVKNGNLVMVTSALPGEGKTFSALNLAMSIAMEVDRSVLLVDADIARPALPRTMGVPEGMPGLLDVIEGKVRDLGEALLRTNVERLTFLPSGVERPHAAEMLTSHAMHRLLAELASRDADRIVIFDSPPLLVTTDARALATHMGQIVFVVHSETTLQEDAKAALATIESCPVKMVVLNAAAPRAHGSYGYGYGYGHGNGYGYGYGQRPER